MNLINCRGLNCHLACVINIAAVLGINYKDAFCNLWSETDFMEDPKYHIYLSRRIIPNLEAMGAKLEVLSSAPGKPAQESFLRVQKGEFFIIGADTFHIPWSPFYKSVYEPHYFFSKEDKPCILSCFDPTYYKSDLSLWEEDIIPYAFDISRIIKDEYEPKQITLDLGQEARDIMGKHPKTKEKLCGLIQNCKNKERECIMPLIKQITAMINNRYLFKVFLYQRPIIAKNNGLFFSKEFFSRWEAVKNGLNKAYVIKDNIAVIDEAVCLLSDLLCEESDMAKELAFV